MPKKEYRIPVKTQIQNAGLITVNDIKKKYLVSLTFIYNLVKTKKLKPKKIFNKSLAFDPLEIEKFFTGGQK